MFSADFEQKQKNKIKKKRRLEKPNIAEKQQQKFNSKSAEQKSYY